MRKREKISIGLFIFGGIWFFAENFYFGWHLHSTSAIEGAADFMVYVFWGLAFFIRPTRVEVTNYEVKEATFNNLGKTNINLKKREAQSDIPR